MQDQKILNCIKIKDLEKGNLLKLYNSLALIPIENQITLKDDIYETQVYYPASTASNYFLIYEKLMPSLLIGEFDSVGLVTQHFNDTLSEAEYDLYKSSIKKYIPNVWDYTTVKSLCNENRLDITKILMGSLVEDTLVVTRDVSFAYNSNSDISIRGFTFLEKYLIENHKGILYFKKIGSWFVNQLQGNEHTYFPFLYEPFFELNGKLFAYLRNTSDSKKGINRELIASGLVYSDNSDTLNYAEKLLIPYISVDSNLLVQLKDNIFGNGSKLFKWNSNYYIVYYYLQKVVSVQDGSVMTIKEWINSHLDADFNHNIVVLKDWFIDEKDQLHIVYVSQSKIWIYSFRDEKPQYKILMSKRFNNLYKINKFRILSYGVSDDKMSIESYRYN